MTAPESKTVGFAVEWRGFRAGFRVMGKRKRPFRAFLVEPFARWRRQEPCPRWLANQECPHQVPMRTMRLRRAAGFETSAPGVPSENSELFDISGGAMPLAAGQV